MNRLWLAVILGVLIGIGVGAAPAAQVGSPPKAETQLEALQPVRAQVAATPNSFANLQAIAVALLMGVLIAAPFLLMARRRIR